MNIKNTIKYIKNPRLIFVYLLDKGILNWLNDRSYLKIKYKTILSKKLDLSNPKAFNEKLQWLKLYDRKDIYTTMVDKSKAKEYVANIIGEEYIIPTIGIYDTFEDIDFDKLPNQFVLKPTHTSGDIFICKNKNDINYKELKTKVNKWLKRKYFYLHREWPYKNIKPRLIIEKYMVDDSEIELKDYKFMCFNGKVKMEFTCSERFSDDGLKVTFFDTKWNKLPFERKYKASLKEIKKPINFEKMIELSEKLSKELIFSRIDWYETNGKLYFGEITFYPGSGYEIFNPEIWDYKIGDLMKLPNK